MNLIDLIRDLVDNPQQLLEYKQDPARYLERAGIQPTDRQIPVHTGEVITIMSLVVPKSGGVAAGQDKATNQDSLIHLQDTHIQISTLYPTFLAEGQKDQPYLLLPHSYLVTEPQVCFDLHILYLRSNDLRDSPQILYIRTVDQPVQTPDYNLAYAQFHLTVSGYALVSNDPPIETILHPGSIYDPDNKTLTLNIDYTAPKSTQIGT